MRSLFVTTGIEIVIPGYLHAVIHETSFLAARSSTELLLTETPALGPLLLPRPSSHVLLNRV